MIGVIAWAILDFFWSALIGLISAIALDVLVDGVRWALGEIGIMEQVYRSTYIDKLADGNFFGKLRLIFSFVVCF